MKTIGFNGGSLLSELGCARDVESFFYWIDQSINPEQVDNINVITQRLYRHYVAMEELDVAIDVMSEIRMIFRTIDAKSLNWENIVEENSKLNTASDSLEITYEDYFERFSKVVESAKCFYDEWNIYQAVKIIVTDMPEYMNYKKLSLDKYDSVVGKPLWQR